MADDYKEATARAKATIQSKWQELASTRTLGWSAIERVQVDYPFIKETVTKLAGPPSRHLPTMIFLSRESPPSAMELAIPYQSPTGNPYQSRVVGTGPLSEGHVKLVAEVAQAIWFLLDQRLLPSPHDGGALQSALVDWTGKELFEL